MSLLFEMGLISFIFIISSMGPLGRRVQRVQRGRFLRLTGPMGRRGLKFDGAFGPEGCGGGSAADYKKGARLRRGLCRKFVKGKVDGPSSRRLWPPVGGGLCSLRSGGNGPSGRGWWIALWAMLIKSALRDWLSVSYGMIRTLVIGSLRSPPLSGCAIGHTFGVKVQRVQRVVVAPFGR